MSFKEFLSTNVSALKFLLRALRYRNYRLFFVGQGVSLIGTWMQIVTVSWLVYRLTGSPLLLGIVGFSSQIPTFILAPLAGVLADRFNRKRILIITQILSLLQALTLAFLSLFGIIRIWQVITLSIILGLINSFDIPTRQAFVADMIEKREDLGNAIALNSSLFNIARFIGPSLAGVIIATAGEGICFLLNGLSFMAVILALLAMRIKLPKALNQTAPIFREIKEGFRYVFGFVLIRYILLLLALVSLTGMSYAVLMPIVAREILKGGAHTYGFLMGATGLGALIGALYLASQKNACGMERIVLTATVTFGTALIAFSFSRVLWLSILLMMAVGFGMMVQMAASNTILQNITDDNKRGRVMSFFAMSFMGMAPFGSLLGGALANKIGAPYTIMLSGFSCILGVVFFAGKFKYYKK